MSCRIESDNRQNPDLLKIVYTLPGERCGNKRDFSLYYDSLNGTRYPVINCAYLEDSFECPKEGFSCRPFGSNEVSVTVPLTFVKTSGELIYQSGDCYTEGCQVFPGGKSIPAISFSSKADPIRTTVGNEILSPQSENSGNGANLELIVGRPVALFVLIIIIIIFILGIQLFRKWKRARGNGLSQSVQKMEENHKKQTMFSKAKDNAMDGYKNNNTASYHIQPNDEWHNFLPEVPFIETKGSDSFPSISADKPIRRMEEGQENATTFNHSKKKDFDGYKNKNSGVDPGQFCAESQNLTVADERSHPVRPLSSSSEGWSSEVSERDTKNDPSSSESDFSEISGGYSRGTSDSHASTDSQSPLLCGRVHS